SAWLALPWKVSVYVRRFPSTLPSGTLSSHLSLPTFARWPVRRGPPCFFFFFGFFFLSGFGSITSPTWRESAPRSLSRSELPLLRRLSGLRYLSVPLRSVRMLRVRAPRRPQSLARSRLQLVLLASFPCSFLRFLSA